MCILCTQGRLQNQFASSRRKFLTGAAATAVAASGLNLFAPRPAAADDGPPEGIRPAGPALRHPQRLA